MKPNTIILGFSDAEDLRKDDFEDPTSDFVSEKLATSLTYSRDVITLPATRFTTGLTVARIDASFSTRMFLSAFIQYNSVTRQLASNIRYQLIHRPLSDLFLVYNDTQFIDVSRPTALQLPARALTLKYTHLFSF